MKHPEKEIERVAEGGDVGFFFADLAEKRLVFRRNLVTVEQIFEWQEEALHAIGKAVLHFLPCITVKILERQEYDGARSLLLHGSSILGDAQAVEQFPVFLSVFEIEKILHHGERQRFAEAPRPRDERHGGAAAEKFGDEAALVDEVELFADVLEIFRANGNA